MLNIDNDKLIMINLFAESGGSSTKLNPDHLIRLIIIVFYISAQNSLVKRMFYAQNKTFQSGQHLGFTP